MLTAGDRPSMKSTSGLSIWPRNCRAYAESDSTYLRWPSAKIVSNARLDLPDPDSPVNTIMASRGRSSETSLRLCSRAPRTTSRSATVRSVSPGMYRLDLCWLDLCWLDLGWLDLGWLDLGWFRAV